MPRKEAFEKSVKSPKFTESEQSNMVSLPDYMQSALMTSTKFRIGLDASDKANRWTLSIRNHRNQVLSTSILFRSGLCTIADTEKNPMLFASCFDSAMQADSGEIGVIKTAVGNARKEVMTIVESQDRSAAWTFVTGDEEIKLVPDAKRRSSLNESAGCCAGGGTKSAKRGQAYSMVLSDNSGGDENARTPGSRSGTLGSALIPDLADAYTGANHTLSAPFSLSTVKFENNVPYEKRWLLLAGVIVLLIEPVMKYFGTES